MLYREIIAVCSEIHTKHINTLCGQDVELNPHRCTVQLLENFKVKKKIPLKLCVT